MEERPFSLREKDRIRGPDYFMEELMQERPFSLREKARMRG